MMVSRAFHQEKKFRTDFREKIAVSSLNGSHLHTRRGMFFRESWMSLALFQTSAERNHEDVPSLLKSLASSCSHTGSSSSNGGRPSFPEYEQGKAFSRDSPVLSPGVTAGGNCQLSNPGIRLSSLCCSPWGQRRTTGDVLCSRWVEVTHPGLRPARVREAWPPSGNIFLSHQEPSPLLSLLTVRPHHLHPVLFLRRIIHVE